MYFQYDSNGTPFGFVYNGTQYFYLTNQMNDVVGITDIDGNLIAQYEYDEWGNPLSVTNNDVANANPIRYRGYYYDSETGYYYLQSRYYDASICRFINADIPEIAKVSRDIINGANTFAYCNNDPVNDSDPTGQIAISVILGAIFGMVFAAIGWFLDKILEDLSVLSNMKRFKSKISSSLSTFNAVVLFVWELVSGAIEGALATTNKYQLFKNIYNVISTVVKGLTSIKTGLDVLSLVIECIVSFVFSKMLKTEQTFSKFNNNKIKGKAKALTSNIKKLSSSKMKELVKLIKNQIVYYIKNNKTLYKRFITNYSLSKVSSWTSKLPQLWSAIKKLA